MSEPVHVRASRCPSRSMSESVHVRVGRRWDVEKAIQSEYPTFYVRVEDSDGAVRLETPKIRPTTGRDALLPYMTAEPPADSMPDRRCIRPRRSGKAQALRRGCKPSLLGFFCLFCISEPAQRATEEKSQGAEWPSQRSRTTPPPDSKTEARTRPPPHCRPHTTSSLSIPAHTSPPVVARQLKFCNSLRVCSGLSSKVFRSHTRSS
jgi:hypothetical protein